MQKKQLQQTRKHLPSLRDSKNDCHSHESGNLRSRDPRFRRDDSKRGIVYLVGAGPGDASLLTLKGRALLTQADVVIYDYLVNTALLEYAPHARHRYVGKTAGAHYAPQSAINRLLLQEARRGRRIVRLKGGDPFVFGRGGEEALFLAKHHVPFEIVPGVTAGVACAAYAGIPLTHRDTASAVVFLTGHEDATKLKTSVDWQALASSRATLVAYMGMKRLAVITRELLRHGKSPKTPVAVIRWGTRAAQQVVTAPLKNITQVTLNKRLMPPAIVVIGEVVNLRKMLKWFEAKPLFGKRIMITRPPHQTTALRRRLEALGAEVIACPTIDVTRLTDWRAVDQALARLSSFDWLVFTSANGVEHFFARMFQVGKDMRALGHVKVCAIGPQTAAALRHVQLVADVVPHEYVAEGIVAALQQAGAISGKRFLLPRADIGRKWLPRALAARGAREVVDLPVYRTVTAHTNGAFPRQALLAGDIDYLTFTSASTVGGFKELLASGKRSLKLRSKIISIGPHTSQAVRASGWRVFREAREYTIAGVVNALLASVKQRN